MLQTAVSALVAMQTLFPALPIPDAAAQPINPTAIEESIRSIKNQQLAQVQSFISEKPVPVTDHQQLPNYIQSLLPSITGLAETESAIFLLQTYHQKIDASCDIQQSKIYQSNMKTGAIVVSLSGKYTGEGQGVQKKAGYPCVGWGYIQGEWHANVVVAVENIPAGVQVTEQQVRLEDRAIPARGRFLVRVADVVGADQQLRFRALKNTPIAADAVLDTALPQLGQTVRVIAHRNDLTIAQIGTIVPCQKGFVCAQLDSGKQLRGVWKDRELHVSLP